jgi:hypothetical protein
MIATCGPHCKNIHAALFGGEEVVPLDDHQQCLEDERRRELAAIRIKDSEAFQ